MKISPRHPGVMALACVLYGSACAQPSTEVLSGRVDYDGFTRIRVPVVGEDGQPLSRYNPLLEAAGKDPFPETLTLAAGEGEQFWKVSALVDELSEIDPTIEEVFSGNTPGSYPGICFIGDPLKVASVTKAFTDSLFSEMYQIGAWRYGDHKVFPYDNGEEWEAYLGDEWHQWELTSPSVLLETTASDGGETVSGDIVPSCGEPISCDSLDDQVIDLCLPDDSEDTDVWACMTGLADIGAGHPAIEKERFGRSCCRASSDWHWCADMPCAGEDCEAPAVDVRAEALPTPEGVRYESGFLGFMKVTVHAGEPFSAPVLAGALGEGQRLFGEECDGVPTDDVVSFSRNASAARFIHFLRTGTQGWATAPTPDEVSTIEAYLNQVGMEKFRVFYGRYSGEVCAGDGEVSYNLVWNVETNEVLYVILYPYSE